MTDNHLPKLEPDQIVMTARVRNVGYEKWTGRCGWKVTLEDIKKFAYHPHFGGRDAICFNGRWTAIRHTD